MSDDNDYLGLMQQMQAITIANEVSKKMVEELTEIMSKTISKTEIKNIREGNMCGPCGLLGAMWIIEGLGEKMANDWAGRIESLAGLDASHTHFLRYHGENDGRHMDKMYRLLDRICTSEAVAADILSVATVVGRLYALQLEEIDIGWHTDSIA